MDYSLIKSELLKSIRGDIKQKDLSQQMGFSFNQVHKWESGLTQIKWNEFIRLSCICGLDMKSILGHILKFSLVDFDPGNSSQILKQFMDLSGLRKVSDIARRLSVHPSLVRRWIQGNTDPSLEMMMRIFDLRTHFLILFLGRLNKDKANFTYAPEVNLEKKKLLFFSYFPFAFSILAFLQTSEMSDSQFHTVEYIAKNLGLSSEDVTHAIKLMVKLNILTFKNSRYEIIQKYFNMDGLDVVDIIRSANYWTRRIDRRQQQTIAGLPITTKGFVYLTQFRVIPISKKALDQVNRIMTEFTGQLQSIVESDTDPYDRVSIIMMNHFHPSVGAEEKHHSMLSSVQSQIPDWLFSDEE